MSLPKRSSTRLFDNSVVKLIDDSKKIVDRFKNTPMNLLPQYDREALSLSVTILQICLSKEDFKKAISNGK